jgi:diacylglycerol kinase (ATP)
VDADDLVALLTRAGHSVRHLSSGTDWRDLLQDPGELVVAAGGDATVADVALAAADAGTPFAILPLGTANNVARALEVYGDAHAIIASWAAARLWPFDIGLVRAPWGAGRFVEGAGVGLLADLMATKAALRAPWMLGPRSDRGMYTLRDALATTAPRHWDVSVDGTDASGEYLAVEALNIRLVGPGLELASEADPGDGQLDVVFIGSQEVSVLDGYLADRLAGRTAQPLELPMVRARTVRLGLPAGAVLHLDDNRWPTERTADPAEVLLAVSGGAVQVLRPA